MRPGVARAREDLAALTGLEVAEVQGSARRGDVVLSGAVLVGTEAVLHRVGSASLVVFLDFDHELLAPRYRAGEQALALLALASRIVGGRRRGGHVVVRTRLIDHEVVAAALPRRSRTPRGGRTAPPEALATPAHDRPLPRERGRGSGVRRPPSGDGR